MSHRGNDPWLDLATAVSNGSVPGMEVLRERGRDVRIARVTGPERRSVIVKCWCRTGLRGALRRLSGSNVAWREYVALCRLHAAGIPCPPPLAYRRLDLSNACHTEALVSGDLGICRDSTEWYKRILQDDPPAARAFEGSMVEATAVMVKCGLIDTDHRLPNFVIPPDGVPVRLDFELCIPTRFPMLQPARLGRMIGVLLGSYHFAVQPDIARSTAFARQLLARIPLPAAARRHALRTVGDMLDRQQREAGIASPFEAWQQFLEKKTSIQP